MSLSALPVTFGMLGEQDLVAAHALTRALAWPHRLEDWRMMLDLGAGVAVRDSEGVLIGTGLLWPWGEEAATVGLILVSSDRQGQGIGRLIVDWLMQRTAGRAVRLHATKAGLRLYETVGFERIGFVRQWQGMAAPQSRLSRVHPATSDHRPALVALDARAFGAERPRLIDALISAGDAMLIEHLSQPVAFGFRRPFGRGNLIGPVVASNADEAGELVSALMVEGFNRIDLTDHASSLALSFDKSGLRLIDTVAVMTARGSPPADVSLRMFALASQAFG